MARMLGRARSWKAGRRDDMWFTDPAGGRRRQRHREQQVFRAVAAEAVKAWQVARVAKGSGL